MPSALCSTRRGLAGIEGRHERWRCGKKTESCFFRTFCVVWADSGRGGAPLGGARPHRYTTSGSKRDGVASGICAGVGTEGRTGVLAVDADFVPRDLPPGGGKVLLLPRRVTCWKNTGKTHDFCSSAAFLAKRNCRLSLRTLSATAVKQ